MISAEWKTMLLLAMLAGSAGVMLPRRAPNTGASGGRVTPTKRGKQTRVAERPPSENVVEDSKTEEIVQELNRVSLRHHRCHSIENDPAPNVDPFKLVSEDIAPLSNRVSDGLKATDPVLTASAQHFFGSGRTREGKRVRPVIVLLMGNVSASPLLQLLSINGRISLHF